MSTIFLVRHGENKANITKEFSYKLIDYNLTERGVEQASQTAEYFKNCKIGHIFSSPLKRAIQTAEIIGIGNNIEISVVENFREINVGDLENKKPDENSWKIFFSVISEWYLGKRESSFPNGENYNELIKRFYDGLYDITKAHKNEKVIVVGHGGIFTSGIVELCSIKNKDEFASQLNHNCSITEIETWIEGDELKIELKRWADHKHLSGNAASFVIGLPELTEK